MCILEDDTGVDGAWRCARASGLDGAGRRVGGRSAPEMERVRAEMEAQCVAGERMEEGR
jgi:hypothetical protein